MANFSIWLIPFLMLSVYGHLPSDGDQYPTGNGPPTTTNEETGGPHGKLTRQENEELQRQCGYYPVPQHKSFGSEPATRKKAPWVVGMMVAGDTAARRHPNRTTGQCSATLISNRHVLTAWHCLNTFAPKMACERFKETNSTERSVECFNPHIVLKKETLPIDDLRFVIHENCVADRTKSNCSLENATIRKAIKVVSLKFNAEDWKAGHRDLAIFELEIPVEIRADLYPACLSGTHPAVRDILDLYAFGEDGRGPNSTLSGSLQHIQLSTVPCSELLPFHVARDGFCVRSNRQEQDHGDSGGGLVYQNNMRTYVTGVVSGGYNITDILIEHIDTAVAHHLSWICRHTGICVDTITEQIKGLIDTITLE